LIFIIQEQLKLYFWNFGGTYNNVIAQLSLACRFRTPLFCVAEMRRANKSSFAERLFLLHETDLQWKSQGLGVLNGAIFVENQLLIRRSAHRTRFSIEARKCV